MTIITCSSCGFTADEAYFNVEETETYMEAECCECGNWTTLDSVSLFNN